MTTAVAEEIKCSFLDFYNKTPYVFAIRTEDEYSSALETLADVMVSASDSADEPLLSLIDLMAGAIERYENSLEEVQQFEREVDAVDPAVSALRLLIDQYSLRYDDLRDEIGSKSLISQILTGKKSLTRKHIANLSRRFSIDPALFF